VSTGSRTAARDLAAMILVAVACPAALFGSTVVGGALLGCAAQEFTPRCAVNGILVSPVLLVGAGILAGFLTSGWPGLGFVTFGVVAGLVAIPLLTAAVGNPVPIDAFSGMFALLFFLPPVALGYGLARGVARLRTKRP
jgi:Na+/phosphate symporter